MYRKKNSLKLRLISCSSQLFRETRPYYIRSRIISVITLGGVEHTAILSAVDMKMPDNR